MGGSLYERVVKVTFYRSGDIGTTHGLNSQGFFETISSSRWPGSQGFTVGVVNGVSNAVGLIYKGGSYNTIGDRLRTSDRGGLVVIDTNTDRAAMGDVGVRGRPIGY
ncbi:MAG: hypothetical protein IPO92_16525 [Saprospiraceae bacterium]|nr:hypothetical protein [Saprospiraceae bacterium]